MPPCYLKDASAHKLLPISLHLHQTLYHSIIAPLFKTMQGNHSAEHKELEGERSNTYGKPTEATRKAGSPAPKGIIWWSLSPPYGPLPHSQQVSTYDLQ
jgi:hypothetical protein